MTKTWLNLLLTSFFLLACSPEQQPVKPLDEPKPLLEPVSAAPAASYSAKELVDIHCVRCHQGIKGSEPFFDALKSMHREVAMPFSENGNARNTRHAPSTPTSPRRIRSNSPLPAPEKGSDPFIGPLYRPLYLRCGARWAFPAGGGVSSRKSSGWRT